MTNASGEVIKERRLVNHLHGSDGAMSEGDILSFNANEPEEGFSDAKRRRAFGGKLMTSRKSGLF